MNIIVYTKTVCPNCISLKRDLKKNGVNFEEVNIQKNEEAYELLKANNFTGLPVLSIDGKLTNDLKEISHLLHKEEV